MALSLTADTAQWEALLKAMGRRGLVAVARGLNRTASSERTAMARAVAADMGLKVGVSREAMAITKATANNLEARVTARGKRIPLINFKARGPYPSRGRGAGVTYTMQGQRKIWRSAFIATTVVQTDGTGGAHRGVFFRVGKNRLPIKQAYGPSIAHVFGKLLPAGEARRQEVLVGNVMHEINFEISRLKAQ